MCSTRTLGYSQLQCDTIVNELARINAKTGPSVDDIEQLERVVKEHYTNQVPKR